MPLLEQPSACDMPLIDLASVSRPRRAEMWGIATRSAFPSLTASLAGPPPTAGLIERVVLGASEVYSIESAPVEVCYKAEGGRAANPCLSLMVQDRGTMEVRQAGHTATLRAGDLCLLDEAKGFHLSGEVESKILFVRLPRAAVMSRHPRLEKLFVTALPGEEPGTAILADTLRRVARDCGRLGEGQRSAMAATLIHMLGMPAGLACVSEGSEWRVRRALDFIEANLSVAGLTAETVAHEQHISRRRLDQLMHDALGESVAGHLWKRRMEQAAADLRDCNCAQLSIAQIAFANGFEDPAHFTRAFKRRYAITPGKWRLH